MALLDCPCGPDSPCDDCPPGCPATASSPGRGTGTGAAGLAPKGLLACPADRPAPYDAEASVPARPPTNGPTTIFKRRQSC